MNVFVLMGLDSTDEYADEMSQIYGIFSTKAKASEIMYGKAKEIFPEIQFSIEEWELDDFSWYCTGNFS